MSQDNTSPRDGAPREQGQDGVPSAPQKPSSAGQQPPAAPWTPPSGLQPDPAPDLDPDFVPNPADQPDPALPPTDAGSSKSADAPVYAGPQPYAGQQPDVSQQPYSGPQAYAGQQPYAGEQPYPGQEWPPRPNGQPGPDAPPEPHGDPVKRQRWVIGGIVVGVLILIGVVIWVLLNLLGTRPEASVSSPSAAPTAGPLPRDAEAKDFQVGDCFSDFDANSSKARAVACDTEHSAQLGAVFSYPAEESFPGTNALKDKGREVCKSVKLNEAADNYVLLQQNVYPSTTSWDRGDRRVDCFIVVDSGNTINEDLLKK
ncbi:septum formation family protein [Arthrobacter sp. ISL-95]|uniref:septum formation family protein n=1 Tax=Arthrobacter sp. ISL-95 TaxID=2819116 RepID=UPI0025706AEC|nr:septum formation family protein [Arthrobacter sp. ISL-95]